MATATSAMKEQVKAVRHFNRFMTKQIGFLREGLLHTPYSPAESRVLFEIGSRQEPTASILGRELGLDAGYLSRMLTKFEERGLIVKERSENDGRQWLIRLTPEGQALFELLDERSDQEIIELLGELSDFEQKQLVSAMETIEQLLRKKEGLRYAKPYYLREPVPGDMGLIVHKHGSFYAQEYGWNAEFEALVSQIVADYIKQHDPQKERCWVAEMTGELVGSIFLMKEDEETARLRLLIVDPKARGLGLGSTLVEESIRYARRAGYKRIVLWTTSLLTEARHIYKKAGFRLVQAETQQRFGKELTDETWELQL